ncbi:MAG: hypothetical protein E7254_10745 [Lachnospiraceae bacterium]|nr:hypothetical protein [Lachnospiraceae bacterium]
MKRIISKTDIPKVRNCVFCKNWWDPSSSLLTPKNINKFEFDPNEFRACSEKNNLKTKACHTCPKFQSKF